MFSYPRPLVRRRAPPLPAPVIPRTLGPPNAPTADTDTCRLSRRSGPSERVCARSSIAETIRIQKSEYVSKSEFSWDVTGSHHDSSLPLLLYFWSHPFIMATVIARAVAESAMACAGLSLIAKSFITALSNSSALASARNPPSRIFVSINAATRHDCSAWFSLR